MDKKKKSNHNSNTRESPKGKPSQNTQQSPFSEIPPELLYALLKGNDGNVNASVEAVREGLSVQKNKSELKINLD